jgi:hypothetical protein
MNRQSFHAICSVTWISSALFVMTAALPEEQKPTKAIDSLHCKSTSSRQRKNGQAISAASKVAPPGTKIIVKERRSGRSITLKVNDARSGGGLKVVDYHQGKPEQVKGAAPTATKVVSTKN